MRFRTGAKFSAQVWDSGRIVIYENASAAVKSEYVPESHLQCTATCVRWEGDNLLVIGGQDGTVIIFDALEAKVKTFLKKTHAGAVEDVVVLEERVLSCGQDGAIHEYHLTEQTRLRWEESEQAHPLYSLCLFRGNTRVLAASISQLRIFHAQSRQLLKSVVTQHVSPVKFLLAADDGKLLSGADRHVVVWSKKLCCEDTLVLSSSSIASVHSLGSRIAAVSQTGECILHDRDTSKKTTIQFASPEAEVLEIHEARLIEKGVIVVYGPPSRPRIETLPIPSRNQIFIRTIKKAAFATPQNGVPVTQYKSTNAKVIGPLNERVDKTARKAPRFEEKDEVSLEERLLECHSDSGKGEELEDQPVVNPRTDNMVHLLLQGLQSGDKSMLNAVIFRNDPEVIDNTVRRLPLDAIQIFVKEIQDRLHCRPRFVAPILRWTKSLLVHHTSYLESCPNMLQPLEYILKSRLINADRVSEVKSRLDTLLASNRSPEQSLPKADVCIIEEDSDSHSVEGDDAAQSGGESSDHDGEDEDEGNFDELDESNEDDDDHEVQSMKIG
ncbi:WD repeat-containing protein 43 [Galendromus occidentalis]|uniref:WD repeat-containing protein 43 n=1 Tax=Galendromus occidentalis TaxID=34638 RepID=A0AAJ6QNB2_9ACAR|nr:WD repeat-containing protein 43 [Galendromus occidentalis]